jgi:hypothetical protein
MNRRDFLSAAAAAAASAGGAPAFSAGWYDRSFYILHFDYHTNERDEVGRDADPDEVARLLALSRPDAIQMHAKGRPGWTTYPSSIGHVPPNLKRDVMQIWRDAATRNGARFVAYYNLGRDGEIQKRHPEWNRVNAQGAPVEHALCYHSGVAEQYLWPMLEEIIDRYRPDAFWFDGSVFTVQNCYCRKCEQRFRREHNMGMPKTWNDPGWAEFKQMHRQIFREFLKETCARIRQRAPATLIAVNWAFALRMPEEPDGTVDYLTGDRGNEVHLLSMDAHWYDSTGLPFELMTDIQPGRKLKSAVQIEQEMAIIIANGGRYSAWDVPTRAGAPVAENQRLLAERVAPFLRSRQPWCQSTRRVPEIGLLHSYTDFYAETARDPRPYADLRERKRTFRATDALWRARLNYEMVSSARLERGSFGCRVLIVDDPVELASFEIEALERFVSRGGTLGVTGSRLASRFGAAPERGWTRTARGKGVVVRAGAEMGRLTAPDLAGFLDALLPASRRQVHTDAPPAIDTILRSRGDDLMLHLVNRTRVEPDASGRIDAIPGCPACHLSLLLPRRPRKVELQPQGRIVEQWAYRAGRLEMDLPGFDIHQIVVIRQG